LENPDESEILVQEARNHLQGRRPFQDEASAAHENMPMKIQPELRRSCGRARDKIEETRSTRCTQT
jgi:hypothetical protein